MSVIEEQRTVKDTPNAPVPLWHVYPGPGYPKPIGAVAYCGHVKSTRTIRPMRPSDPLCVVCDDLSGRA